MKEARGVHDGAKHFSPKALRLPFLEQLWILQDTAARKVPEDRHFAPIQLSIMPQRSTGM